LFEFTKYESCFPQGENLGLEQIKTLCSRGHDEKKPADKPPNKIHTLQLYYSFSPFILAQIRGGGGSYQHTTCTESVGLLLLD
jgi:hypothetical protein